MTLPHPGGLGVAVRRLRGTNMPPAVPFETDASGNPLPDVYTNANDPTKLRIPCTTVHSASSQFDGCPDHLATATGAEPDRRAEGRLVRRRGLGGPVVLQQPDLHRGEPARPRWPGSSRDRRGSEMVSPRGMARPAVFPPLRSMSSIVRSSQNSLVARRARRVVRRPVRRGGCASRCCTSWCSAACCSRSTTS
jgi:hypothetical protein